MTTDLKPCPFCGESAASLQKTADEDGFGDFFAIRCKCGAQSREHFARETCPVFYQGVRDSWNTRKDPKT